VHLQIAAYFASPPRACCEKASRFGERNKILADRWNCFRPARRFIDPVANLLFDERPDAAQLGH